MPIKSGTLLCIDPSGYVLPVEADMPSFVVPLYWWARAARWLFKCKPWVVTMEWAGHKFIGVAVGDASSGEDVEVLNRGTFVLDGAPGPLWVP